MEKQVRHGAGSVQVQLILILKIFLVCNLVCINFDATFWVPDVRRPDAID